MSYFSRQAVSRPPMGRPLNHPAQTFAALLYARLSGHSRKRAQEILATNPNAASGAVWSVATQALNEGVTTAEAFEAWLQRESKETK